MFHRRRASSNPPAKAPPTAAASTAAVQAFLASRASQANLSSAAAAAALRSRPTTPTPVGDLPTKRRAQRSGSVSSNGSSRPNLQRQNSAGSMTERTFRDPSPSRLNPEYLYQDDPPPVPALPKGYVSPPPLSARSIRRPASVEPPERVVSPVPRAGGRGVSLDRAPGMVQPKQPKKQKRPNLGTVGEAERTQSRESINFSRPMSPQNSPPTSPLRELKAFPGISQPYTPTPTANMGVLRDGEADNIQYAVQDSATRPVKKKKKAAAKEMVEGSHFARRSEAKPTGAPLDSSKKAPVSTTFTPSQSYTKLATKEPTGAPQPGAKKKKKRVVSSESSQGSYASDSDSAMSDRSSSTDRPRSFNTRAAGILAKQPSIVREDREAEEQEDNGKPAKQKYFKTSGVNGTALTPGSGASATAIKHGKSVSQPPSVTTAFDDSKHVDMPGAPGNTVTTSTANGLSAKQPRPQSLSPGRAAHFLPQPMYETPDGIKHQPPARSVSPAKSALKHSPSSRGASPVGFAGSGHSRLSGAAGSEASDNGSVVSDDGSRLQPAKKKNARVSFDEDPVTVGHASIPPATDSPTLMSPQHKDSAKKGFLGFGRRREAGASAKDLDQDDGIKPTPALPSFGSVRGRDRNEAEPVPRQVNEQGATQTPLPDTATSSDQTVGHVLSQDFASKSGAPVQAVPTQQASNDPLPPEVTSVEGSGYHSEDEESTSSERGGKRDSVESTTFSPAAQQPNLYAESAVPESSVPETKSRGDDQQAPMQNGFVPSIAILPATPGIGSNENEAEGWFSMPGGFSASDADHEQQSMPWLEQNKVPISSAASAAHHATDPTPASLGIAEPEPESTTTSTTGSPIVGHVAEGIHHQTEVSNDDESDDTGNSIYSDAAEDISDLEGDGFGSINAIMESPVAPRTPFLASIRPESPVAQAPSPSSKTVRPKNVSRNESELSEPASEEGWDQAQAYWSGLSQSRKQQLERAAQPDDTKGSLAGNEAQPVPKQAPAARPPTDERPKKKKMVKKANQSTNPPLPPWPDREFRKEATRPASPTGGGMKQSMRSSRPEGSQAQMRSSMRNGVPLKSSLRNSVNIPETQPAARGGSTKKCRPLSAVAMGDYEKGKEKPAASHGRAASVGVTPKSAAPLPPKIAKPALRRAVSDGSDSSSSFKKSRPSTSDGGKYSMKRTMRGASTTEDRPQSAYASKPATQGVRPSSPTSRRPFSTAGSGMRTSMRDSMDSGLGSRTKSPSRSFGFGRKTEPKAAAKKTGSRFTSRFGDSSDEDEAPIKRRSRIVDSSDEEDNVGLTPVRGIPRRIDEGDSTDLEDSSASPSPAIQSKDNKSNVPATKAAGGFALATGSLRAGQADRPAEKEKKKRSFFGGLGGSKKQSQPPPINTNLPPASTSRPPTATYSSPQPPASPQSPKAARLVGSDVAASPNPSQASPKSPKLQRRNTPKRFASDSWPLPESNTIPPAAAATMANNEKLRPSTSDGAGVGKSLAMGTLRPEPGNRRVTAEGQPVVGTNGAVGGPAIGGGTEAKKRRFPMLRKALGLKDSGRK
ncbi:hypothetical protein XANCAGTX0491_005307 [Xanthoria calcicola]